MNISQKGIVNITLVILVLVLVVAFGYFIFVKNSKLVVEQSPYPYVLQPLTQNQLSNLRSEFESSNKNICSQINEYGFTEYMSGCSAEIPAKIEIGDETTTVELVKNWLVQNSKFTGITNKSNLVVDRVMKVIIELRIDFHGQIYNGLPVEGDVSPFVVFANAKGISRVDGHFFPKIIVPNDPRVSEASAISRLIGRTFTYSGVAGQSENYKIEKKNLDSSAQKVVFVKKSPRGLEFRLAWKILVRQGLPWNVYIDALTGEELKVVQMFNT